MNDISFYIIIYEKNIFYLANKSDMICIKNGVQYLMRDLTKLGIQNGLIVSCQALEDEPLFGSQYMAAMAAAAERGGAVAIRANTPEDIAAIKQSSHLPVIGLYKSVYSGYDVYITPTMKEVREVAEAGADVVAIDATKQIRPDGNTLALFVDNIRKQYPDLYIMADISTFEEGVEAMELGVDLVSTTLSGYTSYSLQSEKPDIELVSRLSSLNLTPIVAEGRIWTVEECQACMKAGAYAVVMGTAITRPQEITKRYVKAVRDMVDK